MPLPFAVMAALAAAQAGAGAYGASRRSSRSARARKEAERRADLARQAQEVFDIGRNFLSQLPPGSNEYNEYMGELLRLVRESSGPGNEQEDVRRLGMEYVKRLQDRVAGGGAATAYESRTDLSYEELAKLVARTPFEQDIYQALLGEGTTTASGDIYKDIVSQARGAPEDDVFQNALSLVEDKTRMRAAERGLLGSGLEIESLGRAGVEAAIAEAERREAMRQNRLGDFERLYNAGQGLRQREIGLGGYRTNMQFNREKFLEQMLFGRVDDAETSSRDLASERSGLYNEGVNFARGQEETDRQDFTDYLGTFFEELPSLMSAFPNVSGAGGMFTTASGVTAPVGQDEVSALLRGGYGSQVSPNRRVSLADLLSRSRGA